LTELATTTRNISIAMPAICKVGEVQLPAVRAEQLANTANPRIVVENIIGRAKTHFAWVANEQNVALQDITGAAQLQCAL
jgi:hypothetical protein